MPQTKKCTTQPVKWDRTCHIDYRTKVGTDAWTARHPRWQTRKLSAWRRLHDQHDHEAVSAWGSSSRRLRDMIAAAVRGSLARR